MATSISYGVLTFEREGNAIVPSQKSGAPSGDEAIRRAKALLSLGENVGVVAFWCLEDAERGELSGPVILASIGDWSLGP